MKKLRKALPGAARRLLLSALFSCLLAMLAFASDAGTGSGRVDITAELVKSFESMADVMIGTIFATLPAVLSVMSAFICIQFGIKFFKRFAK